MATGAEDWVIDAAEDIMNEDIREGFHGHYHETGVKQIVNIIRRHSPFKDGVAYMLVPRCDGCRHWNEYHECRNDLHIDIPVEIIRTAPNFGCVQFEAK